MDDDEIRDALGSVAPAPSPSSDSFEAIMRRAGRGRTRGLGIALAIALVAGPAAGVVVGLNIDDGKAPVTVASGSAKDSRQGAPAVAPETATASGSAIASGGSGFPGGPKLEPLFVRTPADGIAIRAYRADVPVPTGVPTTAITNSASPPSPPGLPVLPPVACAKDAACATQAPTTTSVTGSSGGSTTDSSAGSAGSASGSAAAIGPGPGSSVPSECFPEAILRAELSNQAAVEPGFMSVSKLGPDQPVAVIQAGFFGIEEGSPAAWAAIRTSDAVTTVRVHFADGSSDEMAPVQGYAVLAHQSAAPSLPDPSADPEAFRKSMLPQGTAEGIDASGAVVATIDLATPPTPPAQCVIAPPRPTPPPDSVPPGAASPATAPAATTTP